MSKVMLKSRVSKNGNPLVLRLPQTLTKTIKIFINKNNTFNPKVKNYRLTKSSSKKSFKSTEEGILIQERNSIVVPNIEPSYKQLDTSQQKTFANTNSLYLSYSTHNQPKNSSKPKFKAIPPPLNHVLKDGRREVCIRSKAPRLQLNHLLHDTIIRVRNKRMKPRGKTVEKDKALSKKILHILKHKATKLWDTRNSLKVKNLTNEPILNDDEDCQTVIEYNCENDYTLIYESLNNLAN